MATRVRKEAMARVRARLQSGRKRLYEFGLQPLRDGFRPFDPLLPFAPSLGAVLDHLRPEGTAFLSPGQAKRSPGNAIQMIPEAP